MRRLIPCLLVVCPFLHGQTRTDWAQLKNIPNLMLYSTGHGAPVGSCVIGKSTYTDLDANLFYRCGPTGWIAGGSGGGSPGGSPGQVQTNCAGAFCGVSIGGDALLNSTTGALVVTKTNGASFGDAATKNTGTATGTVAAGDHTHAGVYEPANANIQSHITNMGNPHSTTASQVGAPPLSLLSTLGDTVYRDNTGWQRLAGNILSERRLSCQTGTGTVSAAPTWCQLATTDIPDMSATYLPLHSTADTASNLTGTPALPNGVTATTQTQSDNSAKIATTAYADILGAGRVPYSGASGDVDLNGHKILNATSVQTSGPAAFSGMAAALSTGTAASRSVCGTSPIAWLATDTHAITICNTVTQVWSAALNTTGAYATIYNLSTGKLECYKDDGSSCAPTGSGGSSTNGTNGQGLTSNGSGGFGTPVTFAASATTDTTNAANIASGILPAARLPAAAISALGGVNAQDCTGIGHVRSINADGTVTCSADAAGSGGGSSSGFLFPYPGQNYRVPAPSTIVALGIGSIPYSYLFACSAATLGSTSWVTDSSTATWGATVTGGGGNAVQARCNGANWTVFAK